MNLTTTEKRVIAALEIGPAGQYKISRRANRPQRIVRETLAALIARDIVHVADVGPQGGRFHALVSTYPRKDLP